MLLLGYASIGMTVSSLVIGIVCRVAFTLYTRKRMGIRPKYRNMPTSMLREILAFSFWVFVSNVVGQLYKTTDTVMMGALPELGTAAISVYNVGATFSSIIGNVSVGVSALLGPSVNKLVFRGANNEELTDYAIKFGRIQSYLAGLLVSGFIAFGKPFINFYAGAGYEDAYWVAVFMAVPSVIYLTQSVCLSITVARNQHQFRSLVYLLVAIINVTGTWFAMQKWGTVGAALMTGISVIIGQGLLMNWYYYTRVGLNILRFWNEIVTTFFVPFFLCVLTGWLGRDGCFYRIPLLLLGIVIYTCAYCVLSWFFAMNSYEKKLAKDFLQMFYKN
jgi:O-antigen/teichoic acid export membrane protein